MRPENKINSKEDINPTVITYKQNGDDTYISIDTFMESVKMRNPGEPEFHEAVREVVESIWELIHQQPKYIEGNILKRMTEPERMLMFRVPWVNDQGNIRVNRGYRVDFSSTIGPYKGGLRFHPSVNLDIVKFLSFEQTLKNSLTTLPMGGAKGGANFDVKGKSDMEVMRFCQSFMNELYRHIGEKTDIPAGDIGVGEREIGYLFGQYKRLKNEFDGTITGKGISWGGSRLRSEATGYGVVYFVQEMLQNYGEKLEGKTVSISGSGNVAQYAAEKARQQGAKVITLSDTGGTIYDPDGIDENKLQYVMHLKNDERGRIKEYALRYDVEYLENQNPWSIKCDIALPCATENEISASDASMLISNGCLCVAEGANKPCTSEAVKLFLNNGILFGPGKAANAGGVAVSGLEMSQNGMRIQWPREKVEKKLQEIMKDIHDNCVNYGKTENGINYLRGANIAGFIKVADAMLQQGVV